MKALDKTEALKILCKSTKMWGMFISINNDGHLDEIVKAAPYLNFDEHAQLMLDGGGHLLFETEDEMFDAFWSTVGDDGPTRTNNYSGECKVYAVSCNPDGQLMNENT